MKAQVTFKTILPQQPVISGESFQVQYIIEDAADSPGNFIPPLFSNFRIVAGPNIYTGSVASIKGRTSLRNAVYTLVAQKPGKFIIHGATATINGKMIRSNDVLIEVIPKEEAARRLNKGTGAGNSGYFLQPGEDAYEKIRQNLFLKVMVDKKSCFVGEPVLATFKLYSRLESKSDIVKNPGFYGFTVYDMVNLADKQVTTEKVNGTSFDVHTIRKVQLYPLQAGVFTIDAMEIKNNVEFSRSAVNRKTEQEIVEGVLDNNDTETPGEDAEAFESDISSAPVVINVKPVPVKNKRGTFNGAAGMFTITAMTGKDKLAKNEEGIFEIIINGKGNFIQLSAPSVQWPAGIEGFEPVVKDSLDKTMSPLAGTRIFRYPFVSATPGVYTIPAVSFTFFNPDSGVYKTIATPALQVNVSNKDKVIPAAVSNGEEIKKSGGRNNYWLIGGIILLLSLCGSVWSFRNRKMRSKQKPDEKVATKSVLLIEEILQPATLLLQADDKNFYTSLHQAVWKFFIHYLSLSGSEINKESLFVKLKEKKIDPVLVDHVKGILQQCEAAVFTKAEFAYDKQELLNRTKIALEQIKV